MALAMLYHSGLPSKYWGDAYDVAVYIFNRILHGNAQVTPFEAVHGYPPKVEMFRVFGTKCKTFIPKEKRDRLNPERVACRLIGYGDDDSDYIRKGYKLLIEDPKYKGGILYSSDVEFDEDASMDPLAAYPKEFLDILDQSDPTYIYV